MLKVHSGALDLWATIFKVAYFFIRQFSPDIQDKEQRQGYGITYKFLWILKTKQKR